MYTALLAVHSYMRWVVLLLALLALARALGGMTSRRPWTPTDEATSRWLIIAMDVQFLLGLILYAFLSPITREAFADFAFAMRDRILRFWAVEHTTGMVIAIALAHIGRTRIHKAADAAGKHKGAVIFFGLALLLILLSIPWPGLTVGRVLFRGLGM